MLSFLIASSALQYGPREGLAASTYIDPDPTNLEACDTSATALTTAFALSPDLPNVEIPRICIDTPGVSDKRCYYLYVPDCVGEAETEVPLVFDNHGLEMCPTWMVYFSGWAQKATEECFVVVWPLGTIDPEISDDTCWMAEGGIEATSEDGEARSTTECCCYKGGQGNGIDVAATSDPEFLRAVAVEVVRSHPVDPRRVYMAGHSNGCMLGLTMAAQHSDIVAAVCCHAGFPVTPVAKNYSPVPIWLLHGKLDTYVPYDGLFWPGFVNPGGRDLWLMDAPSAAEYFAEKNGCDLESAETSNVVEHDGTSTRYSSRCDRNADVELVTLPNAGHNNIYPRYVPWLTAYYQSVAAAGSEGEEGADAVYPEVPEQAVTADTTAWAWDFCSSHAKEHVPKAFRELKDRDTDEAAGSDEWRCSEKTDASSCRQCGGKWRSSKGCVKPRSTNWAKIRSGVGAGAVDLSLDAENRS